MNTELEEKMQQAAREYASPFDIVEEIDLRCNVLDAFYAGSDAMYTELAPLVEWVSVKERLPEKGDVVLIKCKNYNGLICNAWFDGSRCHIDFINGKRYSPDFTHWKRIEL
jgi:hypothetical protein